MMTPKVENDLVAVTEVLADYYRAFSAACNKLDAQAILQYFHEPALLMSAQGVAVASTHAALAPLFTPAMESLRTRGFTRSELTNLHVKQLSAGTTLASGIAVRYRVDGQELDRVGVMYLVQKTDSDWKIAALVVHDTDNVLLF